MCETPLTTAECERLAREFVRQIENEDPLVEHCAVITRRHVYVVPNRAQDPSSRTLILESDVPQEIRSRLIGFAHTHPDDGCDAGPSEEDFDLLREGQIGFVWKHNTWYATFYDSEVVFASVWL